MTREPNQDKSRRNRRPVAIGKLIRHICNRLEARLAVTERPRMAIGRLRTRKAVKGTARRLIRGRAIRPVANDFKVARLISRQHDDDRA